jgi:hypothetical protein
MTAKSDFFNENNGKYYQFKDEPQIIVCNLKQSWSLAKMQEAVDAWQTEVDFRLTYEKWAMKFRNYAIAIGYSHNEICFTSVVGIGLFKKYKDDLAGALDELRDRYGLHE